MHNNGQLISLDFLFAAALLVLIVGVSTQFLQITSFEFQQEREQTRLQDAGQMAALLVLSSPQLACSIKDIGGQIIGTLNNCVDTTRSFSKASLGLAPQYEFNIFNKTDGTLIAASSLPTPQTKTVFSTEFNAVVYPGQIPKTVLYNCLKKKPSCSLTEKNISIAVWK